MTLRALAPVLALGLFRAGILLAADEPFPPLPEESERSARNDSESQAGVVVLESVHEISGTLTWQDQKAQGEVMRSHRYRYLVLNSVGAERFSVYPFFHDDDVERAVIRGRTVTVAGTEYPLDPVRDMRRIEIRHPGDETPHSVRTLAFSHVLPGAIVDLAWTQHSSEVPGFELAMLQEQLPVRSVRVKVQGQLQRGRSLVVPTPFFFYGAWTPGYYWVPFFVGGTPPRATVTLDPAFNLDLVVTDIPPAVVEPFSPPLRQAAYTLGLMPRVFSSRKKISRDDWLGHLVIFGTPGMVDLGDGKEAIRLSLDPAASMIRFDDLGFQSLPDEHWARLEIMEEIQDGLKTIHKGLRKNWTLEPIDAPIAYVAPADLPWKERAERLFEYARDQIAIDPTKRGHAKVSELLREPRGTSLDRTLYLWALLQNAQIPTRLLQALSRYGPPFHPVAGSTTPFRPSWLLEVGPPGEQPIHVMPGLRYGSFAGIPEAYRGALAFAEPVSAGDDWPLRVLPHDAWSGDVTEVETRAVYGPGRGETTLRVKATLSGEAGARFRRELDPLDPSPKGVDEHRRQVFDQWARDWIGARFTGTPPSIAEPSPRDEPVVFELSVSWTSGAESHGEEVLLTALPGGVALRSPFVVESRSMPIWPPAGRRRLSHAWSLPAGAVLAEIPAAVERTGPRGLAFRFEVTAVAQEVVTRLTLDVPTAIPASEYAAVRAFYHDLEVAAASRLRVGPGRVARSVPSPDHIGTTGRLTTP